MSEIVGGVGDLLSRLKRDGVEAGEAERSRIIAKARAEADQILADARAESRRIAEEAHRLRESQVERMQAELKLAARDFVAGFHQRMTEHIARPMVDEALLPVLKDPAFLSRVLGELIVAWLSHDEAAAIDVVVSSQQRAALEAFFSKELTAHMEAGRVRLEGRDGLIGFRLAREGDTFVWDVSLDAVAGELAALVDPTIRRFVVRMPTDEE